MSWESIKVTVDKLKIKSEKDRVLYQLKWGNVLIYLF